MKSSLSSDGVQFPEILKVISQSVCDHSYVDNISMSTSENCPADD